MNIGNRILLITPKRLGDTIFCTPAISLLHSAKPNAEIDVLALSECSAEVFEHNPAIRQIFITPDKKTTRTISNHYDVVLDLHNTKLSKPYVKWLNKPVYTIPRANKEKQSKLFIDFILSLLETTVTDFSERYRLYPQKNDFNKVENLLREQGIKFTPNEILIGCHMGNHHIAKRLVKFWRKNLQAPKSWPIEKFRVLQEFLYEYNPNIKLVLTGQPAEQKLAKQLNQDLPNIINLIGQTTVLELAALMSYLNVFLTGDTGPLHIAAATEIPIVAFFGPTNVDKTGPHPRRPQHTILEKNPLDELAVSSVKDALLTFI